MAVTAKQYSYTSASAWIQSTNISASHSGTQVTISGTINMYSGGSYKNSISRYVVVVVNGNNYYNCGAWSGSISSYTTYNNWISYSLTIDVGNYDAGTISVGFYISDSPSSLPSSGTLIWNGHTSTSTSDCTLKTTGVDFGSSWTSATAPTSVWVDASYALAGANVTLYWSGQSSGVGNGIYSYTIFRNGVEIGTVGGSGIAVNVPGTDGYTFTVRSNATYNLATSSAGGTVIGYTEVSGPTYVNGGTDGYMNAGASFALTWGGAANGANNPITGYTVNGAGVGNVGVAYYNSPGAGGVANYTVRAIGTRNSNQIGSTTRTIYGVSVNAVSVLNVAPTTIINSVTLSWAAPVINSANTYGLYRLYTLQYSLNNANWYDIATGVNATSYTWNPNTTQVPYGSLVYFRIIPYVYYSSTLITNAGATGTAGFLRGELPNKLKKVIIKNGDTIGTPSTRIFDGIDGTLTISGSLARLQNGITLTVTPGAKKSGYIRGFAGRWTRYSSIGTSGAAISSGTIPFTQVLGETESTAGSGDIVYVIGTGTAIYAASDNDVIQFEIWAVSRINGNDIASTSIDLTTNATNTSAHFRWNAMPYLRVSPAPIVSHSVNTIIPVNYNEDSGVQVTIEQILGIDETTSNFVNCGYKLYCRDITTNPASSFISVLNDTYKLFGTDGIYTNGIFIPNTPTNDQNITLNIIGANASYLQTILDGTPLLSTINKLIKLEYKITTIDSLKREGTSGVFTFQLQYDFRVTPLMESAPIIYSGISYPTPKNIIATGGPYSCITLTNRYESELGDAVVFEWEPAYDANNKSNYTIDNGHKIAYTTGIDPIKEYRLYRYTLQGGIFVYKGDTKLIAGVDYTAVDNNGYVKYQGIYHINLTNPDKDEIIYFKVVPVAINNKTDVNDNNAKLNHYFYCTRLTIPSITLNSVERNVSDTSAATLLFGLSDNGSSHSLDTITINESNWDNYNNLLSLKINRTTNSETPIQSDFIYSGIEIPYNLADNTENALINFPSTSLDSKIGYQVILSATITYRRIIASITNNILSYNINEDYTLTSNNSVLYLSPAFGTLALRKNKIGINKSDLEVVEEALMIVGKDRVDGTAGYYKNIVGIDGNIHSQMPNFDGIQSDESLLNTQQGSYIGFYTSSVEGVTTWQGSLGFEVDGTAYVVIRNGSIYKKTKLGQQEFTNNDRVLVSNADTGIAESSISLTVLGYLSGVTSSIQNQLNAKQAIVAGVSSTEIGYLDGVTSSIQTQLNNKAASSHTHSYLPLSGGALTGDLQLDAPVNGARSIWGYMGNNDLFRITASGGDNAGSLEIATADDGNEPIYVRQYTGSFATVTRTATLLDGNGNTVFPGGLYAGGDTHQIVADRLYRRDAGDGYNLQHYWNGTHWILEGYNEDSYHAGVRVAYATNASYADSTGTANYANSAGSATNAYYPYFNAASCYDMSGQDVQGTWWTGFYMGANCPNAPTGDWYYYISMYHNSDWQVRIAVPLSVTGTIKWKSKRAGAWGGWYGIAS